MSSNFIFLKYLKAPHLHKKISILLAYLAFLIVHLSACPLISENVKLCISKSYYLKSLPKKIKKAASISPKKKLSKLKGYNLNRRFKPTSQDWIIQELFALPIYTENSYFENTTVSKLFFRDQFCLKNKAPPAFSFLSRN